MRAQARLPLGVWARALIVASVLGGGLVVATRTLSIQGQFEAHNLERLSALETAGPPSELRVVALGSSLLREATPDDPAMASVFERETGRRLSLLRINRNNGYLRDFSPLGEAILRTRPTVLVVQADLLRGADEAPVEAPIDQCRAFLRRALAEPRYWLLGMEQREREQATRAECGDVLSPWVFEGKLARARKEVQFRGAPDPSGLALLREAEARGVKVLVLEIPRSLPIERQLMASKARWKETMLAGPGRGWQFAAYPAPLADTAYCDFVHLNAEGRAVFSQWYARRLLAAAGTGGRL